MTRAPLFLIIAACAAAQAQTMDMEQVASALGVQCHYCHSAPRGSGEKEPKKDIALAMMAMTRDLNAKIQQATGKPPDETARVECVTCHRGVAIPQPLSAIILRTVAQKGGAAAVEQYRDLRKQFFSRDTYDFSEDALLAMVQRVVEGRPDDAIALLRMNLEFNPQSAKTYALIGFAYTRKLDDASAIANLQKSLELDPTNAVVRGRLEQLQEYQRRRRAQ
ncbi:MAG TPA: photosynthetic reaction center cytochrome c subunit family protein [Bryobacteraceae bacterium]|nr:photosynthetic reaction center cytochrome c subunit family protein [Bryobacteraceae bacterium]